MANQPAGTHSERPSSSRRNYGRTNYPQSSSEILNCLYTSQYESHRNRVRRPAEGTCTWVTEHPKYKDWLEQKTSSLLWLSADPGCGKSVIASFLITHLKFRTDATICYFFFKDDNEEQGSATFALCAILHQLFSQNNSLCVYAEEVFKAEGKRFTEEVDTLWSILVRAVTEGGCGDVICVVDALDECEEQTLIRLISHVTRPHGSQFASTPLKFLVTGRPYHKIERELGGYRTTIRLRGEDEINAITADVTRVMHEGIEDLEKHWGRPGGLGYLRNLLESSADRTFLWVSLVLEILKDSEDDSEEEFTNIVSTAPRDIAELYTKILDNSRGPDKARRILHIVVAAARPLTLRELNVAFRIRQDRETIKDLRDHHPGFEKSVKNLCGHFVRIIDSKIYLVHQTAREFLIKGYFPGLGNWQYTLCPQDANFVMTDICISYLSLEAFDPLAMDTSSAAAKGASQNYVQKYPLLDYAATYWADHFRDSQDRQMELFDCTRLICGGGSNRFLTWLRVYWGCQDQRHPFPNDFTHLMMASWLGQGTVVERLLEERGNRNALSKQYGTALNIAAFQNDGNLTRMLLEKDVKAYIGRKGYGILNTVSEFPVAGED